MTKQHLHAMSQLASEPVSKGQRKALFWALENEARDDAVDGSTQELDGLFVEPAHMRRGVGRALVEDAAARASTNGAGHLDVTAGPAQGFYEKLAFSVVAAAETCFGPALRMRREL